MTVLLIISIGFNALLLAFIIGVSQSISRILKEVNERRHRATLRKTVYKLLHLHEEEIQNLKRGIVLQADAFDLDPNEDASEYASMRNLVEHFIARYEEEWVKAWGDALESHTDT